MVTERISGDFSRGNPAFRLHAACTRIAGVQDGGMPSTPTVKVANRRLVLLVESERSELGFAETAALVTELFAALPLLEDADVFARYRSAKWLTATEVSQQLGLSRAVVLRMMERWETAHQRTSCGRLYVAEHEVLAWAAEATAAASTTVRRRR
jgi:predicted DNA-binding transcriptional regulator AlpA